MAKQEALKALGLSFREGRLLVGRNQQHQTESESTRARILQGLLLLQARVELLEDSAQGANIAFSIKPDLVMRYLNPSMRDLKRQAPGAPLSQNEFWEGADEFERSDTRARFLAVEGPGFRSLVPSLPLTVTYEQPIKLGTYDEQLKGFPLGPGRDAVPWKNGGLESVMPGVTGITVSEPFTMPTHWHLPAADARRVRQLEAEYARQMEAERADLLRRRQPAPRTADDQPSAFVLTIRYDIQASRFTNTGQLLVETAVLDMRIHRGTNLEQPFATLPLPQTAIRTGVAAAPPRRPTAATLDGPVVYDPELLRLYMAQREPVLFDNQGFMANSLAIRRDIERRNRRPECVSGGDCIATSWSGLLPPILLTTDVPPGNAEVADFAAASRQRSLSLPKTIRFNDVCARQGVCGPGGEGGTRINISALFVSARHQAVDFAVAHAIAPEAGGMAALTAGAEYPVIVALRINPAWTGVQLPMAPVARGVTADFTVHGTGFVRRPDNTSVFVIELEPQRIEYPALGGGRDGRDLGLDTAGRQTLARQADLPNAPFDVLGVRLGMPLDEARALVQQHFAGSRSTELTSGLGGGSIGSLTPCQGIEIRQERDFKERLRELATVAQQTGRPPPSLEERHAIVQALRATNQDARRAANCQDSEATALAFGFGLEVDHGAGVRERFVLYRLGAAFGPPVVSAIYREIPGSTHADLLRDAAVQRFGAAHVRPGGANDPLYWLENDVRRQLFSRPAGEERCLQFWPGGGGGGIPLVYAQIDCGALIRVDQGRMLLIDSRFAARKTAEAASRQRASPPPAATPQIRF